MASVYIPVQNSEEEVRVALDQLPRDASDILDILKAEQAPLDLWLIIAREYFKQGKVDQFRQILEEGSSPEIDEYYADVRYERIAILNALGAYYSYLGKIETKQREKEEHFIMATQYYNKASRIDMHEPSTWVGKGQLLLAKGDIEQAFAAFKIVLDGDRDNVPALLGQACVQFSRGRYSDSLELYKRALQVYPDCPAAVRLGIGLCRYKLGQFDKAKQAFCRVLQLDPENVDALVALAILDLQNNEASGIRRGMEKMQRAFEIYPYCAMALNYLANHFFFTGQHFLVEQLTETALAVTTHGPTKSHSYYNLARSYHSKGDYEKAGMYYMASVKESSKPHDFVLPYYGLGQVQLKLGDLRSSLANFEKVLEVHPESCEAVKALAHIYVQLGQAEKVQEYLKKATKIDPRDPQAFLDIGELLISNDPAAALEAFKTARNLLKKSNEEVPIELLNNIGVLHFEREGKMLRKALALAGSALQQQHQPWRTIACRRSSGVSSAVNSIILRSLKDHYLEVSKMTPPPKVSPPSPFTVLKGALDHGGPVLRRTHGNEEISISVMRLANIIAGGIADEEEDGINQLFLHVDISKPGQKESLHFLCGLYPDALGIHSVSLRSKTESSGFLAVPTNYGGPVFQDIDEKMRDALHSFIEERGINESLFPFLQAWLYVKDHRNLMRWFKTIGSLVNDRKQGASHA